MSIAEMKWKIVQQLDQASEDAVKEVLELLQKANDKTAVRYDVLSELNHVMEEDKNLLDRLSK